MGLQDFIGGALHFGFKGSPEPAANAPVPPVNAPAAGRGDAVTTPTPANRGRVLLIHGYSAKGEDFVPWRDTLSKALVSTKTIEVGNYITLNNEVTLKDLGEAFDRALRLTEWSSGRDDTWTFDAVVHSTGMLVLRQWLVSDPFPPGDARSRVKRLKHLVGLAPATFGSPQGKQGRSWLGALVKGNMHLGPDFLNAGNQVLDGLELASRYTWELAHKDMVRKDPFYDNAPETPYVAVFIGNEGYGGVAAVANSPGSDGTVRWAGCALNTRKATVDFRREPKLTDEEGKPTRYHITRWESGRLAAPMIAVDGKNHGSLIREPEQEVVSLVLDFFQVSSAVGYKTWEDKALAFGAPSLAKMNEASRQDNDGGAGWQQLLVHVVDDHGDPVTDYNLQLFLGNKLADSDHPGFKPVPLIVDAYSQDASFRCFYLRLSHDMLNLNQEGTPAKRMWLELIASSGSALIEYEAYTDVSGLPHRLTIDHEGGTPVKMDLTSAIEGDDSLLYPYTTTLLEIFVEREPMPLDKVSEIFGFLGEGT